MEPGSQHGDFAVRQFVYERVLQHGVPPTVAEISTALETKPAAVLVSLERLAHGRILVLQPETREILMAPPFSAIPTAFAVETRRYSCFGNCVWDALGIAAMLDENVRVRTSCGDCGLAMDLHVTAGKVEGAGLMHFAVPARDWWQDVVFS